MNPSHGPLDPRFALVTTPSGSVVVELSGAAAASPAPKTSGAVPPAAGADTPLGPDGKPLSKSALKKMKKGKGKAKEKKDKPKFNAPKAKKTGKKIEFVNKTPAGEKKDLSEPMLDAYYPQAVEAAWDSWWNSSGFYTPKAEDGAAAGEDGRFVMVLPPPNVTGSLHLGHALTCSVEDALARWHRMQGKTVLWLPGVDHAGIATQNVVEKMLDRTTGKTRHDLGRDAFLEKIWEWKETYGHRIHKQLRTIGASLDWSRHCFTMDDKLCTAVTEAFVRMHKDGLLYRANRLVNWCSKLNTAIADIEVDYIDLDKRTMLKVPGHDPAKKYEFGVMISFAYKVLSYAEGKGPKPGLADGEEEELVVATTRLETMLGDVAVAVHPEDPRYTHLHGARLRHPFYPDREVLVVTDAELVEMEFGTGAVKITPAHDPNDYECGVRHNLPMISVLDDDGRIAANGGEFAGLMRFDARVAVKAALEAKGLYRGTADNKMRLGLCSRSGDVIEPRLKPQWWVRCDDMAARAVAAVRTGELKINPEFHKDTWYRWLENTRDWCVSRQLWWGHRIPAWAVSVDGMSKATGGAEGWVVAHDEAEALQLAAAEYGVPAERISLSQDPDVLDTWFSSGLFPFSTMGWPDNESPDLSGFFPNSLLETGHDILFFWVARMVMMSLQLTDKLPFKEVYLHAMVRDKYGRKMSKSLGNVIDPLEVVAGASLAQLQEKLSAGNLPPAEVKKAQDGQAQEFPNGIPECGADALRLGLLAYTSQGRDINLDINRVVAYRNFCNKLWNATRFAMTHFQSEEYSAPAYAMQSAEQLDAAIAAGTLAAREAWILSRLAEAVELVNAAFDTKDFAAAVQALYSFWLYDFCDFYLEASKPTLYKDPAASTTGVDGAKQAGGVASEEERANARATLYVCLDTGLRLLHPIMPFVTEELWQRLPGRGGEWVPGQAEAASIMLAPYPAVPAGWRNTELEAAMNAAQEGVKGIRSIRSDFKVRPSAKADVIFVTTDAAMTHALTTGSWVVGPLGSTENITISASADGMPPGYAANIVSDTLSVYVMMKGAIDPAAEIKKLQKTVDQREKAVASTQAKMATAKYIEKVPADVKEKDQAKLEAMQAEIAALKTSIVQFQAWA